MYKKSVKYSFIASFSIMVFLFTFITSTAYGATTTTVTKIGEFAKPTGIAVDSNGDIYVADDFEENAVIKKIDISSNTTTTAAVNFISLSGLAVDSSDNIYASDTGKSWIYKLDIHDGNTPTYFAELSYPQGIALDSSGNIYVATSSNIRKYSSGGTPDENFNINVNAPYGVAVDSNGNIYVADCINNSYVINKFKSNGEFIAPIFSGMLDSYTHIVVDSSNNVYASSYDQENGKNIIYKMKTSGEMETYASYASEHGINGMAVDKNSNIYVTEGKYVEKITVSPELIIDTANPPNAIAGTAYNYTFTSTGGIGTKTYAVTEGSLPSGLKLSTDGTLSGIPTTIGGGTFTITVTDSATPIASTSSATVNLAVLVANSSGGSSSGSSSDSTSTPGSDSTQFLATVTNSQSQYTVPPLPVEITTETDGTRKGKLEIKEKNAEEIVDSLNKKGEDTARIIMPDPKGELSSLTANIPTAAIATFANSGKNLELETPNGGVTLSNQNMKDYANTSNQALNFTITPVKDAITQTETDIRTVELQLQQVEQKITLQLLQRQPDMSALQQQQQQLQQQLDQLHELQKLQQPSSQSAGPANGIINETKERISVLQGTIKNNSLRVGSSVDIESNMPKGISVGVRIPMGSVTSPAQEAELKKDSASYAIFAEHSAEDVESLLINKITIKNMAAVAEASTTRFSRFTIIKLSEETTSVGTWENDEQGWKYTKNGEPVTGWNQIGGYWYLMDSTGIMQTGWKQVNGEWYYLNSDGTMASNAVIDGYKLDENGDMLYDQNL